MCCAGDRVYTEMQIVEAAFRGMMELECCSMHQVAARF